MKTIFPSIILLSVILVNSSFSQKINQLQKTSNLNKTNVVEHYSKFNINNISTFVYNNGSSDLAPNGHSGFIYPRGTNKGAVFQSGLVWGGKIDGKILVGGSTYSQGLLGGKVLANGTPQDPSDESVRVYRVRPDFNYNLLINEFEDETFSYEAIKSQYEKDWNEWPANDGAPFEDVDKNGVYDPAIDIPGIPGAAQTLWYVANDFNEETVISMYGSTPMKVEAQVTVWGYNHNGIYGDVMFKKYKLINKNSKNIDSMYFSIWSDPDLGHAGDDYVGCDTLLNLGYCYNGWDEDAVYGTEIPAIGFQILQGPIVDGLPGEFAVKGNDKIYGKKKCWHDFSLFSFLPLLEIILIRI
ncbi:MAG: hypothetical protein H6613_07245 [Ignavibacteriales bacterium]|nr:hypothetical protein [Ignavibacteriales bacterium]